MLQQWGVKLGLFNFFYNFAHNQGVYNATKIVFFSLSENINCDFFQIKEVEVE